MCPEQTRRAPARTGPVFEGTRILLRPESLIVKILGIQAAPEERPAPPDLLFCPCCEALILRGVAMNLVAIYFLFILLLSILLSAFIPIGNEQDTVRRLPVITFAIIGVNALIFFATLPFVLSQQEELQNTGGSLLEFRIDHPQMLADADVQNKLKSTGLLSEREITAFREELAADPGLERDYRVWLASSEATTLRADFAEKYTAYQKARDSAIWVQYGLAPHGDWKLHQLITYAFLHGGFSHLFFNMLCFFAVAYILEDLWGRGVFLGFYLLAAAGACIIDLIQPGSVPVIGASGAISAVMGAFLIRLPRTKLKLMFWPFSLLRVVLHFLLGRSWTVLVPGYLYLAAFFLVNVTAWYVTQKAGSQRGGGTAFSVHVSGFVFGAVFALGLKMTKLEEKVINPKLEAKVSFAASPVVTNALELFDRGDHSGAEQMLRTHLATNPTDVNALLAVIQVYERMQNYDQLNSMYGQLIRQHFANNDKEAALYAYDNLLACFPENRVEVRLPPRDWLSICRYLTEVNMNREAAIECERLVKACSDEPMAVRAAMLGGEAALNAQDDKLAMRLFKMALDRHPNPPLALRIEAGMQKCRV